jgi:hypothetical protein
MATLDINRVELLAKHATVRPAELTDGVFRVWQTLMILLLLFLQKQSLAFAVYLFNLREARWLVRIKSLANF